MKKIYSYNDFLNELGEFNVKPYKFEKKYLDKNNYGKEVNYYFKTDNDLYYIAKFFEDLEHKKTYDFVFGIILKHNVDKLNFNLDYVDLDVITNTGDLFKIMSTISIIFIDFLENYSKKLNVKKIELAATEKRAKLYNMFLNHNKHYFKSIKSKKDEYDSDYTIFKIKI